MKPKQDNPEATYRQRRDSFAAAERRDAQRDGMLTHCRQVVFVLAAVLFGAAWVSENGLGLYIGGGLALGGFLALITYHEYVRGERQRHGLLRRINEEALARLRRDWAAWPETPVEVPPEHQAVADDLDLFGHASLFHFLCSANTPLGIGTLRDWLLQPAGPDEIQRRQRAVVELAAQLELRERLALEGRLLADRGRATDRFLNWTEEKPWLASRPWLLWPCRIVPAGVAMVLALLACGAISLEAGIVALLGVFLVNLLITVVFGASVHEIFAVVCERSGAVCRYLGMFELLYTMPDSTTELDTIRREITTLGGGVLRRLRQLGRAAALAQLRTPLLFFFVYLPLQFSVLYDFHVLTLLEAWQRKYGRYARPWFRGLGKFEALSSLAGTAYDHPDWALPEVTAAANRFAARRLGHPLLRAETCVANDVEIGPAGSVLLVTGSNMSGKSTLLRAVGVNAVLAQAGAPVCAAQLTMPGVTLATSMRIRDSLEDGVSFYMAELMRLKAIVDLARDAARRQGRTLLYLLDEILQGTNSRERHVAVVHVLHHLVEQAALGAVSTHDVELAASEPLAGVCRCVHFRETLHGQDAARPMTFDYVLRPGPATTTNALKLLEIVGLDVPVK